MDALAAYDNFVFDFYGTLVDIHTDESDMHLWEELAGFYACYGAFYTPEELRESYGSLVKSQEKALAAASGRSLPEIELGRVFRALLEEAPKKKSAILAAPAFDGKCGRQTAAFSGTGSARCRKPVDSQGGRQAAAARDMLEREVFQGFRRDHWSESARLSAEGAAGPERWSEERWEIWTAAVANFFRIASRKRFSAYPNTLETLQKLKMAGKKVFLLSNAQAIFTVPEIEAAGLYWYFDDMYISSEQQVKKPDPSFFSSLMHRHDLDPARTVMVGNDFSSDMGAAALCGVDGIYLNTFELSGEEMQRRLAQMQAETGTSMRPRIIPDGDIGKILEPEASTLSPEVTDNAL